MRTFMKTLLEDEVNILPDNNDGSAEAKELMDEIDAEEINAAEVSDAQNGEFTPSATPEELEEAMYFAMADHEMAWNEMVQEMSINDLGRNVFTESMDDVKDFFRNTKEKIKEFFKKVWQVIQRWASNISATFATNKKFVSKYGSRMDEGFAEYKKNKKWVSGYPYTNINEVWQLFENFTVDAGMKVGDNDYREPSDTFSATANSVDHVKTKFVSHYKFLASANESNIREVTMKYIQGSDSEIDLKDISPDTIVKILSDDEMTKKKIRKAGDQSKKEFKAAIKVLDNIQREAEKGAGKAEDDTEKAKLKGRATNYTALVNEVRKGLKANNVIRNCLLTAVSKQKRQARKLGNIYVRLSNKEKYKGFQDSYTGYRGNLI